MFLPVWALLLLFWTAAAVQASGQNVLVILDDPSIKHTHSTYLEDLATRGYDLTFRTVGDRKLQVRDWDDWLYDQLIVFAPSATGELLTILKQSQGPGLQAAALHPHVTPSSMM